jgi:hypothetical protein
MLITQQEIDTVIKYNILIVTPGTMMTAGYVESLVSTIEECNRQGLTYRWMNGQSPLVHNAREAAITGDKNLNLNDKGPLHDQYAYDKLFMIDSDISWTVEDFFKLFYSGKDVICGTYMLSDGNTTSNFLDRNTLKKASVDIEVEGTGLGFVCVRQGVFENISRPWFAYCYQKHPNNCETPAGEDISWCFHVTQSGYRIFVDPSVNVGHTKSMLLTV